MRTYAVVKVRFVHGLVATAVFEAYRDVGVDRGVQA